VVEINVSLFSPVIHEAQWEQGLYNWCLIGEKTYTSSWFNIVSSGI
jgi:hypothetical protein